MPADNYTDLEHNVQLKSKWLCNMRPVYRMWREFSNYSPNLIKRNLAFSVLFSTYRRIPIIACRALPVTCRPGDKHAHTQTVGTSRFRITSWQLSFLNIATCGSPCQLRWSRTPQNWSSIPCLPKTNFASTRSGYRVSSVKRGSD